MISSNVKMAMASMRNSRIRTLLTMLGIIIGVASVVLTVSLGQGIKHGMTRQISRSGDRLTILPGVPITRNDKGRVTGFNLAAAIGASTLTEKDIESISKVPGVELVVPMAVITATPTSVDRQGLPSTFVVATTPDVPQLFNKKLAKGSFFEPDETTRDLAVIGKDVAQAFFQDDSPIGRTLSIRGKSFIVRGVMEEFQSTGLNFGLSYNSAIFIPMESGKKLTNNVVELREVDVKVAPGANIADVQSQIIETIKANHAKQEDFSVLRQEEFISITDQLFGILTAFVAAIAGISIFVGGIGVMNIMLVSVTERTREIGIRKALGATNKQILGQFMVEAVVLTVGGGLLGILLALIIGAIITVTTDLSPALEPTILVLALGISTLVGIVFGIAPALKAARKDPIESLRHD